MTDDQVTTIIKAIGDSRLESAEKIGALSTTVAAYHADLNARVTAIEGDVKSQKMWGKINLLLVPFYALAHGAAARLGIRI